GGIEMAKKRINIYVDEDIYKEFKGVCALTGETVTSVMDEAMKEYISAIKMILEAGDKDKLMAMIQSRLNIQMNTIESDIDEHLKNKK
ncbi:MAG: plasmid partition protein ParG, partial [Peptostreptococcaceae bacterium]